MVQRRIGVTEGGDPGILTAQRSGGSLSGNLIYPA